MPLPAGVIFQFTALQNGCDGNRVVFEFIENYGAAGVSVALTVNDGYVVITVTNGFTVVDGNQDDWATVAAAVNAVASGYGTAEGESGNTTAVLIENVVSGTAASGPGVYYSAVAVRRFRFPHYVKRYNQVGN